MKKKIGFCILVVLAIFGLVSLCEMAAEKAYIKYNGLVEVNIVGGLNLHGDLTNVVLLDGSRKQVEYTYEAFRLSAFGDTIRLDCHMEFYDYSESEQSVMLNYFRVSDYNKDGLIDEVSYWHLPMERFEGKDYVQLKNDKGEYRPCYLIKREDISRSARATEIFAEAENIYNQLPIKAELR